MNITINGYDIVAEEGITILEAAKRADIHIPTLCYVNKGTSDIPCELCVVSVEGVDSPVRSCITPLREGMRVTTESKELQAKLLQFM
ncbi:MAG: (2Fe-2S)-binding protein, partial [Proteobacteria bacterium]|nr:(2Fe-2S)-binding protein [Pseudomonadota bacterium]